MKALEDEGWIQNGTEALEQNGEAEGGVGNAPWRAQAAGGNVRSREWPPPENKLEYEAGARGKIQAQWPPVEIEEREQQQVEILQTHLPTKPHQRQWPPPQYETEGKF